MFTMVEGEVNFSVYRRLMPLYFPRTEEEFNAAREALPEDCGNLIYIYIIETKERKSFFF